MNLLRILSAPALALLSLYGCSSSNGAADPTRLGATPTASPDADGGTEGATQHDDDDDVTASDAGAKGRDGGAVSDGGARTNDGGAQSDAPPPKNAGGMRVFVTDGEYTGNLKVEGSAADGPAGADKLCQANANAAGLGGTFKAWITSASTKGASRIAPVGPWKRVDGTIAFPGVAVLGNPTAAILVTASGKTVAPAARVWTGSEDDGSSAYANCDNWESALSTLSGRIGDPNYTFGWSGDNYRDCDVRARLYCFEQ